MVVSAVVLLKVDFEEKVFLDHTVLPPNWLLLLFLFSFDANGRQSCNFCVDLLKVFEAD